MQENSSTVHFKAIFILIFKPIVARWCLIHFVRGRGALFHDLFPFLFSFHFFPALKRTRLKLLKYLSSLFVKPSFNESLLNCSWDIEENFARQPNVSRGELGVGDMRGTLSKIRNTEISDIRLLYTES